MDVTNAATVTGEANNELSRAGSQQQENDIESTTLSGRETAVCEYNIPELICVKPEPLEFLDEETEEMEEDNETEPVLANHNKRRCHEVGIMPTSCDEGFVKKEEPDEIVTDNEETSEQEERLVQERNWRSLLKNTRPDMISAFNQEYLHPLCSSETSDSYYGQPQFNRIENSTLRALLFSSGEFYKNDDHQRRTDETPEQRAHRLIQNHSCARKQSENLSEDESEQCLIQGHLYEAQCRTNETPEQREQRLVRMRFTVAKRRANETPDEREQRLLKTRVNEAQRRANESPDEHQQRLIRMRLNEARRRANETSEARSNRLARTRSSEANRRAQETPEEREKRLIGLRMRQARKRANETPEEREKRLMRLRQSEAQRRANETPEEREKRLIRSRNVETQRRANETPEEREKRLLRTRLYAQRRASGIPQERKRQRRFVPQNAVNEISDKNDKELNRMQFDLVQRFTNEMPMDNVDHFIASDLNKFQMQIDISRKEQVENLNMYLSIAKQIENRRLKIKEMYSEEADLRNSQSTSYQVPNEQEHFLNNMHLSKTEEEKSKTKCN
ncbi:hypothetical protein L9F63_003904 [Diploptera punctata]|uniref:STPR domain-containing protein n=1 Tax=Diploptera punctata TaxID=6984 RepID=A0AAD7ZK70_DIPPU|nr:hypothetical protein L9F63_003904 [Diploptera punctata]